MGCRWLLGGILCSLRRFFLCLQKCFFVCLFVGQSSLLYQLLVFERFCQVESFGLVQAFLLGVGFLSHVWQPMQVTKCGVFASPVALKLVRAVCRGLARYCLICMLHRRILHQEGNTL